MYNVVAVVHCDQQYIYVDDLSDVILVGALVVIS